MARHGRHGAASPGLVRPGQDWHGTAGKQCQMARAQMGEGRDDRGNWQTCIRVASLRGLAGGYERTHRALTVRREGRGITSLPHTVGGDEMHRGSRRNSCAGKRVFTTWAEAYRAARHANHQHDETLEQYRCSICNAYHLGHRFIRDRRPREEWGRVMTWD